MVADNLAVVMHGINDLRVEPVAAPEPAPGQVLLAMDTVGICGSDVSFLTKGHIGDLVVKEPTILGHESAGVVVKLGEGVNNLCVGDRVAIEPAVPCLRCEDCKKGTYNLCLHGYVCSTPPDTRGGLSRLYVHTADFCHRLPDNVSLEEGALMEPLSVGVNACQRAGISAGHSVLICGAGPIGLVCLLVAHAMGASEFVVTDISESRLELAKKLGAHHTLNVGGGQTPEALAGRVAELLGGHQPHRTIECSGAESSIQLGILATRRGGLLMLVGFGADSVNVPLVNAALREVDILGSHRYVNCFPIAIALVASRQVDVKPLISHRFDIKDAVKAFETARTRAGGAVKVLIKCAK